MKMSINEIKTKYPNVGEVLEGMILNNIASARIIKKELDKKISVPKKIFVYEKILRGYSKEQKAGFYEIEEETPKNPKLMRFDRWLDEVFDNIGG